MVEKYKMKSGIYLIINLINGMLYVGSAVNLNRRWIEHKAALNNDRHCNIHLQRAWVKYGGDAFQFTIVEMVEDVSKLIEIEQLWINASNCCDREIGYNLCSVAGSQLGFKWSKGHTEELKIAASNRMKGNQINKGRKFTEEHKRNISLGLKKLI